MFGFLFRGRNRNRRKSLWALADVGRVVEPLESRDYPAVTITLDFDSPATGSLLGAIQTPYGSIVVSGELSQGAVPGGTGNGLRNGSIVVKGGVASKIQFRYGGFSGGFESVALSRDFRQVAEFNDPNTLDAGSGPVKWGPFPSPSNYIKSFQFWDPFGARADIDNVVITLVDAGPDLTVTNLGWNSSVGGVDVQYSVNGADLKAASSVHLYWASDSSESSIIGKPIATKIIPRATKAGSTSVWTVPGSSLQSPPSNAAYLIAVVDKFKTLDEGNESNNSLALADVKLVIKAGVKINVVSEKSLRIIQNALRVAGQSTATITSTLRLPEEQAVAMFQNLTNTDFTIAQNIQNQLSLYANAGDQVIRVFEQMVQGMALAQVLANAAAIRQAMTNKIVSLAARNIRVSLHCVTPEQYALRNLLDIRRISFTLSSRDRFISALRTSGVLVRDEPENGAIHLEIPQ